MLNIKRLKTEIFEEIESLVKHKKCTYIDAIILFCETNDVDLEQAATIILNDPVMVAKIKVEAEDLNFLKKGSRLPI